MAPGEFIELELEQVMYTDVKFCNEWVPHSDWLIENKMNMDQFEEEKKFQQHKDTYKYDERREVALTTKSILKASEIQT